MQLSIQTTQTCPQIKRAIAMEQMRHELRSLPPELDALVTLLARIVIRVASVPQLGVESTLGQAE
jgi:hypothetical protein